MGTDSQGSSKSKRQEIDFDSASTLIRYEPDTGLFFWKKGRAGISAGSKAGTPGAHGYVIITILGTNYLASRLAWMMTHMEWPTGHIDHENGIKNDNRISNLRVATISENGINQRLARNNTSGAKGVSKQWRYAKYIASIKVRGKDIYLGSHVSVDEAAHAYNKAAIQYFGEFAVLNPIGVDK